MDSQSYSSKTDLLVESLDKIAQAFKDDSSSATSSSEDLGPNPTKTERLVGSLDKIVQAISKDDTYHTDIENSTKTEAIISALDEIADAVGSSGGLTLQEKIVPTVTTNGDVVVNPDSGYDGMSKVTVPVNVPSGQLVKTTSSTSMITKDNIANIASKLASGDAFYWVDLHWNDIDGEQLDMRVHFNRTTDTKITASGTSKQLPNSEVMSVWYEKSLVANNIRSTTSSVYNGIYTAADSATYTLAVYTESQEE